MSVQTTTHLNFRGHARAALTFYQTVFGGTAMMFSYRDMGPHDPADADNIVWGQVLAENGFRIMAYDVQVSQPLDVGRNSFYVSVRGDSLAEIKTLWQGLAEGAEIVHPLTGAQWTALYGMLKDRFGVVWILDVIPGANAD